MEALYMDDCYLKEFEAEVVSVDQDKFVILNQTAFYPNGGGQPYDTGVMKRGDDEFKVVFVGKFSGKISHEVDTPGLKSGDKVHCAIDWNRRHELMRYHTAAHLLSGVFHREAGAQITGNQLDIGKGRIDFNLESFDRERMADYFRMANELVKKDLPLKIYSIAREEALKDETLFKLANVLPPAVKDIRIVEIVGFDRQADGGTHVKSTGEVGEIEFSKAENKGKNNRRIYFRIKDPC